jgi:hypothetical protein
VTYTENSSTISSPTYITNTLWNKTKRNSTCLLWT